MPAYRPTAVVLAANLRETPAPFTHDRLGRPLIGPCLIWTRATNKGYGVMGNKDFGSTKLHGVHRVAYALAEGIPLDRIAEIPELDHLCRVHPCAARSHLEITSHAENIRRGDWRNDNFGKTECDSGHPFDEANTYWRPGGGRDCRQCHRDRQRASYDSAQRAARHAAKKAAARQS